MIPIDSVSSENLNLYMTKGRNNFEAGGVNSGFLFHSSRKHYYWKEYPEVSEYLQSKSTRLQQAAS